MQKEYEGYNFAVKNLLKLGEKDIRVQSKILGTVADVIEVNKEYITAIETALGGALQNVKNVNPCFCKELGCSTTNHICMAFYFQRAALVMEKTKALSCYFLDSKRDET